MAVPWIDLNRCQSHLGQVFHERQSDFTKFGSTINQIFEAFVFGELIRHYRNRGWTVKIQNPATLNADGTTSSPTLRLKFSTRGRPGRYSFARCTKGKKTIQIHHQLRVATSVAKKFKIANANVCLDAAIIKSFDVEPLGTNDAVPNERLITLGEAKHMSAFAELIAGFVGLVHEIQPKRLNGHRTRPSSKGPLHPFPFLYVSGWLNSSGAGIYETIQKRRFHINIYHQDDHMISGTSSIFSRAKRKADRKFERSGRSPRHATPKKR